MTDDKRNISIAESLNEIKQLEEKLVQLKQQLLESPSNASSKSIAEGEFTSFLITTVMDRRFAIPITGIEEVIEAVAAVPIAKQVCGVIGLINYHGDMIVLFDLAEIAGLGKNAVSAEKIIVICTMEGKQFAVMVDEAADVVSVAKPQIKIADQVMSGFIREIAVVQVGRETAAVVDLWSSVLSLPLHIYDGTAVSSKLTTRSGDEEGM